MNENLSRISFSPEEESGLSASHVTYILFRYAFHEGILKV